MVLFSNVEVITGHNRSVRAQMSTNVNLKIHRFLKYYSCRLSMSEQRIQTDC